MAFEVGDWLSTVAPKVDDPCGLFTEKGLSVPLKARDVKATVYTFNALAFADATETLSYLSFEDCSATFKFPLPPKAAVYRFKASMADREIITEVKPKAQAEEEFRLATQQGHSAVLMKQEAAASIFTIEVGNLEAHTECVVEFSYLRLLDSFSGTVEYVHTATWVPPYIGSAHDVQEGVNNVVAVLPKFSHKVSYSLSYDVHVLSETGAIKSLECSEDSAQVDSSGGGRSRRVTLTSQQADPSKDFSLLVELDTHAKATSTLLLQTTPPTPAAPTPKTLALATFVPTLPKQGSAGSTAGAAAPASSAAVQRELWLVVDGSGSMGGAPIEQARNAALFFVRDLPTGTGLRFNITAFGSKHTSLFSKCKDYDTTTEAQAVKWIQSNVNADLGGTEILDCMQHIYNTPITSGYQRSIVFLTDGGISGSEEQHCYNLVQGTSGGLLRGAAIKDTAARTTVHSLGIGHGVHRSLLDGMAERSSGVAQYVLGDEGIQKKCAFLKKCALAQGLLVRPRLATPGAMVRMVPHVLPPCIFADEPLHVMLEVMNADPSATVELSVELPARGSGGDGGDKKAKEAKEQPAKLTFALPLKSPAVTLGQQQEQDQQPAASNALAGAGAGPAVITIDQGKALSVLHAMAYISGLLAGKSPLHVRPDGSPLDQQPDVQMVKDSVVRLAVAEHLVTPYTSAVGVMLRRDPLDPEGVKKVDVPLQVPHGRALWGTAQQAQHQQAEYARRSRAFAPPPGGAIRQCCDALPPPQPLAFSAPMAARCGAPMLYGSSGGGAGAGLSGAVVHANTDALLSRGEKLESLRGDCGDLGAQSQVFKKASRGGGGGGFLGGFFSGKLFGGASAKGAAAPVLFGASAATPATSIPFGASPAAPAAPVLFGAAAAAVSVSCKRKMKKLAEVHRDQQQQAEECCKEAMECDEADTTCEEEQEDDMSSGTEASTSSSAMMQQQQQAEGGAAAGCLLGDPDRLLQFLNLNRTTEGFWRASPQLSAVLGLTDSAAVHTTRPGSAAMTDDVWATLLVLALLRKRLPQLRDVWGDMEAKAMAWVSAAWPTDGSCKSVGAVVLATQKLLPAA